MSKIDVLDDVLEIIIKKILHDEMAEKCRKWEENYGGNKTILSSTTGCRK